MDLTGAIESGYAVFDGSYPQSMLYELEQLF
jgi:hypothetical protein